MTAEEFVRLSDALTDEDVNMGAVMMAGVVGIRASKRHDDALEDLCIAFITQMHTLTGTPAPPRKKRVQ
jgi:hypothetical protein